MTGELTTYYAEKLMYMKRHMWSKRNSHVWDKARVAAVQDGTVKGVAASRDFSEKYSDSPGEEVQSEYFSAQSVAIEVVRALIRKLNANFKYTTDTQ